MQVRHLWLNDFRSYAAADVELADGLTVVLGANGEGKTNLLEAIGYLATLESFRGAPSEAMIRDGAPRAVVRAEGTREGRDLLIEAELASGGRSRVQVNRQRLQRSRDLLGALRVSVFSPDDLALVKGGPAERRRYLDDTLVALHPRYDQLRSEVERILRQRNALLKQSSGGNRFDESAAFTLDVWDAKLGRVRRGARLAARRDVTRRIAPLVQRAYASLTVRQTGRRRGPLRVAHGRRRVWRRRSRPRGGTTYDVASRLSAHIETSYASRSPVCRRARTRRRVSSARLRWLCAWRRTKS